MNFTIVLNVLKKVLWSFLGEKIMAKLVWWFLEQAANTTHNPIDEEIVAEAKARFYGEKTNESRTK